jgi:hypothetical protein
MKILIQLGKNGDIAMVANHLLESGFDPEDYLWMVTKPYHQILQQLYPQFKLWIVDVDVNKPLDAYKIAKLAYPDAEIYLSQQNGADPLLERTKEFSNYQFYQFHYATTPFVPGRELL